MQKDYFPFVYCVESLVYQHNYTHWETCFEKLSLDRSPVDACYNSERGTEVAFLINYILQPSMVLIASDFLSYYPEDCVI